MGKPAPVPMQCAARRYKAILPPPGSRPRTKSFLLSNSIKLSNPRLTDLRLCPKANVLPSNRSLSEISFSELPSQGSIITSCPPQKLNTTCFSTKSPLQLLGPNVACRNTVHDRLV